MTSALQHILANKVTMHLANGLQTSHAHCPLFSLAASKSPAAMVAACILQGFFVCDNCLVICPPALAALALHMRGVFMATTCPDSVKHAGRSHARMNPTQLCLTFQIRATCIHCFMACLVLASFSPRVQHLCNTMLFWISCCLETCLR